MRARLAARLDIWALSAIWASCLGLATPMAAAGRIAGSDFPILLRQMIQPDARAPGVGDTDLVETGTRRLLGAMDWGGRLFLHYAHRTYWTGDGGRSWRSQGWLEPGIKPPRPTLPEARFRTTGPELYLVSGEGAVALAAFDSAREEWRRTDFGRSGKSAFTALGCDAGAIYLYDVAQELSRSRDGGATWQRVAAVPPPQGGSFFEDIQAQGKRLLLRFNRPYGIATDAGSTDDGAAWRRFPVGADVHLFEGCFHYAADGALRSECGPEGADRSLPAPFARLQRLFRQESGELFALADSGLFHFRPAGSGPPSAGGAGSSGSWEPVVGMGTAEGWALSNGMVSRQTPTTVTWMPVPAPGGVSIRPGNGLRARAGVTAEFPSWIGAGRRPDGRALWKPEGKRPKAR